MSLGALSELARELLDPASPVRRHYEELAGNLLALEGTGIVVVTSPDPGAGRTSVCLGLAAAVAGMGRRAAVVDCNLENSQLHRMLGEPNFVGLTSGLEDEQDPGALRVRGRPRAARRPDRPDPVRPRLHPGERGGPEGRAIPAREQGPGPCSTRRWREGYYGPPTSPAASTGSCSWSTPPGRPRSPAREAADDLLEAGVNLLGVVLNGCS